MLGVAESETAVARQPASLPVTLGVEQEVVTLAPLASLYSAR